MNKIIIDEYTEDWLTQARKTYGNKNQILVCMEELNELACVLAKYPRYEDEHQATQELYDKVLDEVADVTVILNHVMNIFGIDNRALDARITKKITRLSRWLLHSESMQETVDDRVVDEEKPSCQTCVWSTECKEEDQIYINQCKACMQAQATDGTYPFYTPIETI